MKSLYSNLKSCIKTSKGLTDYFHCALGTRQGCKCSPIFFSIFINDLVSYLRQECKHGVFVSEDSDELIVLMYADDIFNFADTVLRTQRQIDKICSFCKCVKMKINLRKTKIVVFRNGGCLKKSEKWTYDGNLIEVISFYKYLGIYMTPKLSWSKTWENATSQAQKAIACIFRYQKTFVLFAPHDIFKLFDSIVCPILTYGAEVWGYQYVNKLENCSLSFASNIYLCRKM